MLGKDEKNTWYTIFGSPLKPDTKDTISKACYQEKKVWVKTLPFLTKFPFLAMAEK